MQIYFHHIYPSVDINNTQHKLFFFVKSYGVFIKLDNQIYKLN